jgi:hypothetical protein
VVEHNVASGNPLFPKDILSSQSLGIVFLPMPILASAHFWYTMSVAFIRTKRRNGRTYYFLVECRWEGKPVQKVISYLPTDSLISPKLRGNFVEQATSFIDGYRQILRGLAEELIAPTPQSKSRADVRFHRARNERLWAKAEQLDRCIKVLDREKRKVQREASERARSSH